ncbi:uncharacterized protein B4U79_10701 [Dinothrombium tinctorium]|uniref:Uncharacterized protein n=1 Tax=Dinothrombium tinctorium TaxID=1965070 RepID=A0A443QQU8_9ACAR|nr:uncharacterized protein B4U79_10701 [Dinothrombium tinctorium]
MVLPKSSSNSIKSYQYKIHFISDKGSEVKELKVCQNAFLLLHNIKLSKLRRKVFAKREETEDFRGKNNFNCKFSLETENDVKNFIENYPKRESHYSKTVKTGRKYIGSQKNIRILHTEFIDANKEYEGFVSYDYFRHVFKKCNVGFSSPRFDNCATCEELTLKIKTCENDIDVLDFTKNLSENQDEANYFYKIQEQAKEAAISEKTLQVISVDFQKNFSIPITKVPSEYYSRQLSLYNFCVHNMNTCNATMYIYSEHYFARKTPNECISCLIT